MTHAPPPLHWSAHTPSSAIAFRWQVTNSSHKVYLLNRILLLLVIFSLGPVSECHNRHGCTENLLADANCEVYLGGRRRVLLTTASKEGRCKFPLMVECCNFNPKNIRCLTVWNDQRIITSPPKASVNNYTLVFNSFLFSQTITFTYIVR